MTQNIFNDFEQNRDHTIELLDGITSPVSLFTVSSEIRFLHFNRAAEELLGYGPGQLLALTEGDPLQIFHPDYEDQLFSEIITAMRQERLFRYDCRMLCADGSYKWINLSAELVQKSGGVLCYHCVLSAIEAPKETLLKGLHALIAAGVEEDRKTISRLMERQGGTCELYNNGLDALDAFAESEADFYQCVFIGCRMRDINGFELAKETRHCDHPQASQIPLILLVDPEDLENVMEAGEIGISRYLEKPLDPEKVTRSLLELIKKASA